MDDICTMEAKVGSAMSSVATLSRSEAVDSEPGSTPLGSAKCEWSMPRRTASAFIFATKAGMLPASQVASRSAKLSAECTSMPPSTCSSLICSFNATWALESSLTVSLS